MPAAAGSVRHVVIADDFAGVRLDRFLGKQYPSVPRSRLFRIVRKGEVRINGKRAQVDQRLSLGDDVRLPPVRLVDAPDGVEHSATTAGDGTEAGSGAGRRADTEPHAAASHAAASQAPVSRASTTRKAVRRVGLPAAVPPGAAPAPRTVHVPKTLLAAITAAIIYEDDRLLAINKPAGLAVHGGSGIGFGVIEALRAARPDERGKLELVHRLDRDTSGVLLVARKPAVLRMLHADLREGDSFEKRYLALVQGSWQLGKKRIDAPLRTDLRVGGERTVKVQSTGKAATSDFRPVQFFGRTATLMEVDILTGRTHQIRVHAAYAGHPVAGDDKYGDREYNDDMKDYGLKRMFLHAASLSFTWPDKGTTFSVNAPLPPELASVIDELVTATPKRRRGRR